MAVHRVMLFPCQKKWFAKKIKGKVSFMLSIYTIYLRINTAHGVIQQLTFSVLSDSHEESRESPQSVSKFLIELSRSLFKVSLVFIGWGGEKGARKLFEALLSVLQISLSWGQQGTSVCGRRRKLFGTVRFIHPCSVAPPSSGEKNYLKNIC